MGSDPSPQPCVLSETLEARGLTPSSRLTAVMIDPVPAMRSAASRSGSAATAMWWALACSRRTASSMMPTWPAQNTRSPRARPPRSAATDTALAELGLLHVAVARTGEAGGVHGDLQQPRAVHAQAASCRPTRRARRGRLRRRRRSRTRSDRARRCGRAGTKRPSCEPGEGAPRLRHAEGRIHAQRQARGRLEVGRRIETRAERASPGALRVA